MVANRVGLRREIGRSNVQSLVGLPGVLMGTTTDLFHMTVMSERLRERLKNEVKYEMLDGPRCLRSLILF